MKWINLVNVWCSLEGHTYLNKPAAESSRFIYVCMTFLWTPGIKQVNVVFEDGNGKRLLNTGMIKEHKVY